MLPSWLQHTTDTECGRNLLQRPELGAQACSEDVSKTLGPGSRAGFYSCTLLSYPEVRLVRTTNIHSHTISESQGSRTDLSGSGCLLRLQSSSQPELQSFEALPGAGSVSQLHPPQIHLVPSYRDCSRGLLRWR